MTLRDYVKIFRQRWLVILATTLIAAGVVFFITPSQASDEPPVSSYTATATLLVSNVSQEAQGESLGRIALYITNGEVPIRAAEKLNHTGEPALLAQKIEVASDSVAQAITIASTDASAETAAAQANAFAGAAVEFFDQERTAKVMILQEATPIPNDPTGGAVVPPSRTIRTLLGAGIGLLLGLGLAIILDHLDNRLRSLEEIEKATGLPIIAAVPKLPRNNRKHHGILVRDEPLGPYADGYRAARSAILHTASSQLPGSGGAAHTVEPTEQPASKGRVILVTSAMAGEGKTTSSANLAASFAETGQRVLVIDADLRKSDLHIPFDVPQGAGASDFLTNPEMSPLIRFVRPTNVPGVGIISAGTRLEYPASLTSRMSPLIDSARSLADVVVIDASPVLMASDALDILPLVDSALLIVRAGRLTKTAANRVAELLGRFQVPIAGAVVIGGSADDTTYGYGYGYGYGSSKKPRKRGRRSRRSKQPKQNRPLSQEPQGATPPNHPNDWLPVDPRSGGDVPRHARANKGQ